MDYQIRPVTVADAAKLQEISRITFKETFDPYTAPADMQRFLAEDYATDKLLAQIKNPDSRFFFLIKGDEVAGYLKINVGAAQTEHLQENALEVELIYLLPKFQHQGLGNILFDYALNIAKQEGKAYVWLGVYEHNVNAQHFYKRHGFHKVSQHRLSGGQRPVNRLAADQETLKGRSL